MKKILIFGSDSYIGTSFENFMKRYNDYQIDTVSAIDGSWREKSFSGYDSVFHVAGIAHIKETKKNSRFYYEINRDLAIEVAEKAKGEKVKSFIFMSSISVYGMNSGVITKETKPNPKSHYGNSKYQAEEAIRSLSDDNFKVCILRPPMVYGKGCKGNFNYIIKITSLLPFFPKVDNKRSLVYIDNLSSFVKKAVDFELSGVFIPQNKGYMNTTQLATWIAEAMGKRVFISSFLGALVKMFCPFSGRIEKAFGTLIYEQDEDADLSYVNTDLEESVKLSV